MKDLAKTLGGLRSSGWVSRSVKDELRANVAKRISKGQPVVDGMVGYHDTVLPELERALLAGHDIVFLGERGQGKTRMVRSLIELLDEYLPIVAGSEVNDDPFAPVSAYGRTLVADKGDDTPIEWVHRSERFSEKLATPDTSIADLIGEIDPIKIAEGRLLSDEESLHFGLVPRTNRGIFAINELPDLAERIQVGLLNVLEERDIQIRGHRIRLPLDLLLVASANPEDYTNRGRIITPLKDRFGSQIRTHYPLSVTDEVEVVRQEAIQASVEGFDVRVPDYLEELVAEVSQLARQSPSINQRSGVSVRLSVANYEVLQAATLQRALQNDEATPVARVGDLQALSASTAGKIELDGFGNEDEFEVANRLISAATLTVFRSRVDLAEAAKVAAAFEEDSSVEILDDASSEESLPAVEALAPLRAACVGLSGSERAAEIVSAASLILEGLHLSKRLNKDTSFTSRSYSKRNRS